jgi:hypothetical protein
LKIEQSKRWPDWPRNFLSVKDFRMDLEADFKWLFVGGLAC